LPEPSAWSSRPQNQNGLRPRNSGLDVAADLGILDRARQDRCREGSSRTGIPLLLLPGRRQCGYEFAQFVLQQHNDFSRTFRLASPTITAVEPGFENLHDLGAPEDDDHSALTWLNGTRHGARPSTMPRRPPADGLDEASFGYAHTLTCIRFGLALSALGMVTVSTPCE